MATTRLRITGGSARGVPLAEPKGLRLRPTSGLVREAIFNILAADVTDAAVLDLFAGTGALGIEALSRGAARATFIDADAGGCQAILQNLARTGFEAQGHVVRGRLPLALHTLTGTFDIIFVDPPYAETALAGEVVEAAGALLALDGQIVYEHASRYNPPERPGELVCTDRRNYGDTGIARYIRATKES